MKYVYSFRAERGTRSVASYEITLFEMLNLLIKYTLIAYYEHQGELHECVLCNATVHVMHISLYVFLLYRLI